MLKLLAMAMSALCATAALAAAEVNQANRAELEAVKGLGPGIVATILAERQQRPFADWRDFVIRVKGVRESSAARLSAAGLTVGGLAYPGAASAPAR